MSGLALADLNDDALRLILDAIGNGDMETACHSVKKWCDLHPRHRKMCQETGDATWIELTRRIFGADAVMGESLAEDPQRNFYALCKRAIRHKAAERWIITHVPERVPVTDLLNNETFKDALGEILEHIDNNDMGNTVPRVRLVEMMQHLFWKMPKGFTSHDLLKLYSTKDLYAMIEGAVASEIDEALKLLNLLANDIEVEDGHEDSREGYLPQKVYVLTQLLQNAIHNEDIARAETILGIWDGLLIDNDIWNDELEERHYRLNDMARYARQLLREDVGDLLVGYIARPLSTTIGTYSASLMLRISKVINTSLTLAMHDASSSREGFQERMELVYGRD